MNHSRPVPDWLSVKEAAAYLSVSSTTIRRLRVTLDPATRTPFLVSCQPAPRLILISTASLRAHREAAKDLEFWECRGLERGHKRPAIRDRSRRRRRNSKNQGSNNSCG